MAYTVLARRYRSGTFDEVIGQDHIAQTLKKAIASGRIAHAYLFCGTRGTGKTSMARILAKALNCRTSDAPTTEPCGKCDSCLAIARGDDMDVIEIDAASNTGVDNVREVIENSQYRPAHSRFKIYIIDEAHMLSKAAFNALLKTLEEPPSHVKFILATTEPEKLLATILSRCQRYDFRNIPTREIAAHLTDICKREEVQADEDALLMVAKAGAGSMRDSLSLLDRLLSVGEKRLTSEMIEGLLGLPKSQLLFDIAAAIGQGDVKAVLTRSHAIVQGGLSVDSLIVALVDHLRNLLILRTCGEDSTLVEVPGLAMKDLMAQAGNFDAGVLAQDIAILEELRRTLRQSQAGWALLDATLVRLTLAEQFTSIGELLSRLDGQPAAAGNRSAPTAAATAAQKKKLEPVGEVAADSAEADAPAVVHQNNRAHGDRAASVVSVGSASADATAGAAGEYRSLAPVLGGEGRGEGPSVKDARNSNRVDVPPLTLPSPPSTGERGPNARAELRNDSANSIGTPLSDGAAPIANARDIGDTAGSANGNASNVSAGVASADAASPAEELSVDDDGDDDLPAVGRVWSGPSESLATLMAKSRAASGSSNLAGSSTAPSSAFSSAPATPQSPFSTGDIDPANLPAIWQAMLANLADHGPMLHSLVSQGHLVGLVDGNIILRFGQAQETFIHQWEKNGKRDIIRGAASKALNQNVGVRFEIDRTAAAAEPAPIAASATLAARRQPLPHASSPAPEMHAPTGEATTSIKVTQELIESLAGANPLIKSVITRLGAQVIKVE